jgi:sulfate adenylyltransferase subunit 1 (EFTu-like GTPase family)
MIITISDIVAATEIDASWFHRRFTHVKEDYLIKHESVIKVSKLISEIERQIAVKSDSKNKKQALKSKEMLRKVLKFLKTLEKK